MNESLNNDEPLFKQTKEELSKTKSLELEKLKQENKRFKELLKMATKSVKWIIVLGIIIFVFDIIYQINDFDNSLLKDCFSLIKYSLTTILGFVFANNANKS